MAAKSQGLSGLTFGVPSITGYVVQTYGINRKAKIATVEDEQGIDVHRRYYDQSEELSLDAVITSALLPHPGDKFTYDGTDYEVQTIDLKGENKGFKKVSIKALKSEGVAPIT